MTANPGRVYDVADADFPISVTIEARNLVACVAFVDDTRISVGGVPQPGTMPVTVVSNGLTKSYDIAKPGLKPCDLTSVINGWFADNAPENAKYVVKIVAANGDKAETSMFPPAVNPSICALVFRYR